MKSRREKSLDPGGGRGDNEATIPRDHAVRSPADRLLTPRPPAGKGLREANPFGFKRTRCDFDSKSTHRLQETAAFGVLDSSV